MGEARRLARAARSAGPRRRLLYLQREEAAGHARGRRGRHVARCAHPEEGDEYSWEVNTGSRFPTVTEMFSDTL